MHRRQGRQNSPAQKTGTAARPCAEARDSSAPLRPAAGEDPVQHMRAALDTTAMALPSLFAPVVTQAPVGVGQTCGAAGAARHWALQLLEGLGREDDVIMSGAAGAARYGSCSYWREGREDDVIMSAPVRPASVSSRSGRLEAAIRIPASYTASLLFAACLYVCCALALLCSLGQLRPCLVTPVSSPGFNVGDTLTCDSRAMAQLTLFQWWAPQDVHTLFGRPSCPSASPPRPPAHVLCHRSLPLPRPLIMSNCCVPLAVSFSSVGHLFPLLLLIDCAG